MSLFSELEHKCLCNCEHHTTETEMDLTIINNYICGSQSVRVEQTSLLKFFVRIVFYTSAIRMTFLFINILISIFANTFYN